MLTVSSDSVIFWIGLRFFTEVRALSCRRQGVCSGKPIASNICRTLGHPAYQNADGQAVSFERGGSL